MSDFLSKTVALVGNPNVGKSTVFNQLTGMNQHTGNWPGKTVGTAYGHCEYNDEKFTFVDLPGTYSIFAKSPDEEITRNFLESGEYDAVAVVCDATCLERNLSLVLQILSVTGKVIICVNLMDEAEKRNINIDFTALKEALGVEVIKMSARSSRGIKDLLDGILNLKNRSPDEKNDDKEIILKAEEIAQKTVSFKSRPDLKDRKIDRILIGKKTGIPVMILFLTVILWITIVGANYPSELLGKLLFSFEASLENLLSPFPLWVTGILVDGIYHVLALVVSVMLPPMAIFFPLFTILEDSGYLPRIAFNLDSCFKKASACGKQSLTMCMGFGCNAVGVTGTRIIDSERERLIAIITNSLVPCNGRFPTLITLITLFFAGGSISFGKSFLPTFFLLVVIILGIMATFFASSFLSKIWLKGIPSSFTLELPPYRKPQIIKVIIRSVFDRTLFVLARAVVVAIPAGAVIWLMANITLKDATLLFYCTEFLDPFAKLFGLDGSILMAFILGFPANEIVLPLIIMAYTNGGIITDITNLYELKILLLNNGWTVVTAICVILFSLMHWPCSTTCITIYKETKSIKWTLISVLLPTVMGLIACFVVANTAKIFGM